MQDNEEEIIISRLIFQSYFAVDDMVLLKHSRSSAHTAFKKPNIKQGSVFLTDFRGTIYLKGRYRKVKGDCSCKSLLDIRNLLI